MQQDVQYERRLKSKANDKARNDCYEDRKLENAGYLSPKALKGDPGRKKSLLFFEILFR